MVLNLVIGQIFLYRRELYYRNYFIIKLKEFSSILLKEEKSVLSFKIFEMYQEKKYITYYF